MFKSPKYIPILIILIFVIFIGLDAVFVYLAKVTYTGVATENAYQKGMYIFRKAEAPDAQWKVNINYHKQQLLVSIPNMDWNITKVEAKIIRPVTNKYDKYYILKKHANHYSLYVAEVDELAAGQWEIRVRIFNDKNGEKIFARRIIIK